ncbi:MAG: hypothetical protein OXI15_08880 [Chromatiales bacterium]|nr:hypothetical protein [Chromatiales bacterium]
MTCSGLTTIPHHRADAVDGMIMVMTPEAWTVIGTGVVVLIAIATSHRPLRAEMNEKVNGLHARMDQFSCER